MIEQTVRQERVAIMASLFRLSRDLELAEEALQEACVRALESWAREGVPDRPGAWLGVVARRISIDRLRRERRHGGLEDDVLPASDDDRDDRLRLLFACCAVDLPERSRVGLALRQLLGLTTREIARAYLEKESTTAQRLVRAQRELRSRRRPTELPRGAERARAIDAVLGTLYLVFNEGYLAAEGDALVRDRFMEEAIRLGETLVELLPFHAETLGLAALMQLQASRRLTRVDDDGELVPLDEQDRSRWDAAKISRGQALLDRALALHGSGGARTGPLQLQAAIAALHCEAPSPAETDWLQIAALYRRLVELSPTPVHELNAAVALAMSGDVRGALAWINALERRGVLADYHLFPAVKAGLLERAGHLRQARRYYGRARKLARNERERRHLTRRIAELERSSKGESPQR